MKSSADPRHLSRRTILKELFSNSFTKQNLQSSITKKILAKVNQIDEIVLTSALSWPIDRINKVDLAILRLAIYELFGSSVPRKVIIDEAIELSKEYGSESSSSFVNGVLGTILKNFEQNNAKFT